ncbi:flagellar FliJ family protein [Gallaecimonas xiamenensis]|uniref:Flagellar FliJ protein n=1 Tax=Gallaecimonas xiamenensis 3-C-1 TaxID=745411 RepID=K2JUA0_9GAMM|nr:flagellar FliJ family protein [Gallaecimonas xiamenensis]EKE73969.1 lateral flagellar protein, LfiJ [Gallaecimonas xiamenensis 3-C-1]
MFDLFLERQQNLLENLGSQKVQKHQQLEQHRQRVELLSDVDQHLGQVASHSALYHQNRLALRRQLGDMLASQQQEMELAQLDLNYQQQLLLKQFGKVKGLEVVQKKRADLARMEGTKQEQQQMDEWVSSRRRTPRGSGL